MPSEHLLLAILFHAFRYFVCSGLATVSYLPELSSFSDTSLVPMFSVIEHYPIFTSSLEKGPAVSKDYMDSKFDSFDKENSAAAIHFLKNSLDFLSWPSSSDSD